jgi:hypothetical protein
VNQDVDIGKRPLEIARRGRFHPGADDARRIGESQRCRNRVDRGQRESRTIIVVHRRVVFGVMLQDPVGFQMAVNDGVNVTLFLGFMYVLGRYDGKQSHRSDEYAGEKP